MWLRCFFALTSGVRLFVVDRFFDTTASSLYAYDFRANLRHMPRCWLTTAGWETKMPALRRQAKNCCIAKHTRPSSHRILLMESLWAVPGVRNRTNLCVRATRGKLLNVMVLGYRASWITRTCGLTHFRHTALNQYVRFQLHNGSSTTTVT